MKITNDEILGIIEDVTVTLGHLLLKYRQLNEALLDDEQSDRVKVKMANLEKQLAGQKETLTKIHHAQRRKKELEKIRKDHEKESETGHDKHTLPEQKSGVITLLDQGGRVVGRIMPMGRGRVNILNSKGVVVAHEINGVTLDRKLRVRGYGVGQGLRILGLDQRR